MRSDGDIDNKCILKFDIDSIKELHCAQLFSSQLRMKVNCCVQKAKPYMKIMTSTFQLLFEPKSIRNLIK